MSISFRQLQAFLHAARCNTFAEAAEKMHLSQPALSIAIKKLEQQLGGRLFTRSTRQVTLSPEGEEFLPVAQRLLTDWDNAQSDMKNLFAMQRGKLTLAAMPSYASSELSSMLASFVAQWPNLNVQVVDVVMESVIQQVREGRCELGFTFESDGIDDFEFAPLLIDEFIAVVPSGHRFSALQRVSWQSLCAEPMVAMNRGSTVRRWLEEHVTTLDLAMNIHVEAGQLTTVGELVRHGLGVAVVPGICRQQMQNSGLTCLTVESPVLSRQLGIVRRARSNISVAAEAFWHHVTTTAG